MFIKNSKFVKSITNINDCPNEGFKEIAIVGRSNVGKSSIINSILGRKRIAKVSSSPGKTRTINFFLINDNLYLVDFPGYGYAKVSKDEKNFWKFMIESYFYNRSVLRKVVLLVDSRHTPFDSDLNMCNWIRHMNYDLSIIATKSDKLKYVEIKKNHKVFKETFNVEDVLFYSALKNQNRDELLKFIFSGV